MERGWLCCGYSKFCVAEGKPVYADDQAMLALDEFLDFAARSSERYEFIDGEVVLQSSPSFQHQKIVTSLGSHLRDWAAGKGCEAVVAPFDVFLKAEDQLMWSAGCGGYLHLNISAEGVTVECLSLRGRFVGGNTPAWTWLSWGYRAGRVGEYG